MRQPQFQSISPQTAMLKLASKLLRNVSGNVALFAAVLSPVFFGAAGVTADYVILYQKRSQLQEAADTAALASAKELGLTSATGDSVKDTAKRYVHASLDQMPKTDKLAVKTIVADDQKEVTVKINLYWRPFLAQHIGKNVLPIKVEATAALAGEESLCVIALDSSAKRALKMSGKSSITANDCAIYSNSSSAKGIDLVRGAVMKSSNTYSGGGYSGFLAGYLPKPITDSPAIEDPLINRASPKSGACDYKNYKLKFGAAVLSPGTYCGGITAKGLSVLTLLPGTYVIKDGPLVLADESTLIGAGVGFYFKGKKAVFDFGESTQIVLAAPKFGPMAGILFFEDRTARPDREFTIRSKDAQRFEGTVYLPRGRLVVDKRSRLGLLSSWTAIVANQIEIKKGPELEINADYASSDIPVPEGIGPTGTSVWLKR